MHTELDKEKWTAKEKSDFKKRGFRARRSGESISCGSTIRPDDYMDDLHRGTLEYMDEVRNYAFFNVVIPDGTVIHNKNFVQNEPATPAITGKNLTFARCNLTNVLVDPTWRLVECNTNQVWYTEDDDVVQVAPHSKDVEKSKVKKPEKARMKRDF